MAEDSAIDALDALLSETGTAAPEGEETGDSSKFANYANLMQKVPLLRSLTEEERIKVAALLKPLEFEDGDRIVTQGEEGDSMYFVESGEVRAASHRARSQACSQPLRVRARQHPHHAAAPSARLCYRLVHSRKLAVCLGHAFADLRRVCDMLPFSPRQAEAVVEGVGVVMAYQYASFFGELALRSNQPRAATVRAKVRNTLAFSRPAACEYLTRLVAQGFSTTVLRLPRAAFDVLMKQKTDLAQQIHAQAASYGGSFDVEESAGPKGTAAMSEDQLRELCDQQVRMSQCN
jgi:hypothetical protein